MLYADDLLLYHCIVSLHSLTQIQLDLDSITSWLSSRFLNINTNKSKYMNGSRKPQSFGSSLPPLLLNKHQLESVTFYKYLGVTHTANLSWSSHIHATCSKTRRLLGMIYCNFTDTPQLTLS